MRILVLTDGFPPDFMGGFEVSANLISRALAEDGFDITVLSRESSPAAEDTGKSFRVKRIFQERYNRKDFGRYPAKLHGWLEVSARFRNGSANVPLLRAHLKENSYDLVLAFALEKSGAALTTEAARHGLPVLWSIGDYWLYEHRDLANDSALARLNMRTWSKSWIEQELGHPFEFVVYNCDNIRQHFAEAEFVAKHTWIVNRSCPIPDSVLAHDSPQRTGNFLMVCQLFPHKGVHVALEAAKLVHDAEPGLGWKLEIVGAGDQAYTEDLKRQVETLGLNSRVDFVGKIPHAEVLKKMQSCRALIHAALWDEPFGRVTMEALAQGAPLISSDSGAVWEIPTENCALIYPKHDSAALAEHMKTILHDPSVSERLIRDGFARANDNFRPDIETLKYRQIIEQILQKTVGTALPKPMSRETAAQKRPLWKDLDL